MDSNVLIMGGIIEDKYLIVQDYPKIGGDTFIEECFSRIGGCSINVAWTLKNLGCNPYIMSKVGGDSEGEAILEYINRNGFSSEFIEVKEDGKTGYCLNIVDKKAERTFMTFKGCEEEDLKDLTSRDIIDKISYVYLTGYYMIDNRYQRSKIEILKRIKASGGKILFDPGPLVKNMEEDCLGEILNLTDIFVPNDQELGTISKMFSLNREDFINICFDRKTEYIFIKRGKNGAEVYTNDRRYQFDGYKVNALDTTGAGDSFAAGCIYGLMKGFDVDKVLNIACACGALLTTKMGSNFPFGKEEILTIMEGGRKDA